MSINPKDILKKYWGFSDFRASQEQIITAILDQKDVLALLPTGGGKSLCFQIPALANEGICIVVSPLIALIKNQVDNLKQKGIKALALTGGVSQNEVIDLLDNCMYGNYKFLYLSPERLQQEIVKNRIQQMNVNLIAIDEAHCISQWGNDFRPSYLNCAVLRDLSPDTPIIALTATATKQVAEDIVSNLRLQEPLVEKSSYARENIVFSVRWDEDKAYQLKTILSKTRQSAIVYVRTRKLSNQLSNYLLQQNISATFFHGGLNKKEKETRLQDWLHDKVQVMVATNAFGMGIDKPDVGTVVHYQISDSIENYFQEAGRAGRNGEASKAIVLVNNADENQLKKQFINGLPTLSFLKLLYNKLNNYFQISFGESSEEAHQLNLNDFCTVYKLNNFMVYNGLRVLDQNSVIALSESFSKKTSIQFIATKNQVFDYLDTYQKSAPIIQTILRTYGGIFEYDTKINTWSIAKKANTPETIVVKTLEQLKKDEIITYHAQHNDIELVFLVPREDERTINLFGKKVELLIEQKTKNIDAVLGYLKNDTVCRSQQLLSYFGEKREKCGKCDVCTKKPAIADEILELVKEAIGHQLKIKPQSSRELIKNVLYKEESIFIAIQSLLGDEKIEITATNEYKII
ncbi:RecQ family ATP-dependent DNA helicase [Cellulophaga baltica]|uniref:RecQ family ATP-dependent DNA helicase n=1 Tax=Cellulophaga TaxID=104264 RepID=UPI001C06827B|nr:ATP-dependent DNA helicase RecQ [Cellulophaga sp. 1_MG-2023]MBU2997329.1 RecQ family ATP-dependent DNA helicase [Cellulophaga baltica]MDO6768727.1 ATP-dependent DNA helicase RecQ [Cellulophaga sp. 1_MG-2023]